MAKNMPPLSAEQFDALAAWVRKEAKLAMAERTYQNDRSIAEVASKTDKARSEARRLLVDPDNG